MKFPSRIDFDFYQSKLPPPGWAARLGRSRVVDIDVVVNAHSQTRHTDGERAAHNLLAIVRRHRGPGLEQMLHQLARRPECMIHPEKRAAFARRWLHRLEKTS